jgi:CheY-like chemotaxis protein
MPVALLVEDDDPVRDLTGRMLALEGYDVIEAANGRKALDCLEQGVEIAVVVTDLVMPVLDGYELLATMRARRPLPSVAMTAVLSLTEEQEKRLGGAPLLYKPFTHESFVEAIRAARFEAPESSYWVDPLRRIVHLRSNARPSIAEKIATVNRMWADRDFHRGFSVIIDRRGHSEAPTTRDTRAFWRYLGSHEARVDPPSAWAIVADRPSLWHFYQEMETSAADEGIALKVFLDYDSALHWAEGQSRR